jgi:hypothetical protein
MQAIVLNEENGVPSCVNTLLSKVGLGGLTHHVEQLIFLLTSCAFCSLFQRRNAFLDQRCVVISLALLPLRESFTKLQHDGVPDITALRSRPVFFLVRVCGYSNMQKTLSLIPPSLAVWSDVTLMPTARDTASHSDNKSYSSRNESMKRRCKRIPMNLHRSSTES